MKLRLALKQSQKNIPSARPKIKVRVRGFDSSTKKAETQIVQRVNQLPVEALDKSLALKSDGRMTNGRKDNPPSSEEMQRVRSMRKFYGRHMPVPQCSTCAFSTNCPHFKADFECAFIPFLNSHKVETVEDLMVAMENMLESNTQRLHLATIFERIGGGAPSTELSESYAMLFQQLQQLHEIKKTGGLRAPSAHNSVIVQLFGDVGMLVRSTAHHHKEIAEAPIDIPTETDSGHQLELTEASKAAPVSEELLEDFRASSRETAEAQPSAPAKRTPMAVIAQGTITKS